MEIPLIFTLAQMTFYLTIILSSIYTLVFTYHWYSYGSSSKANGIALGTYLIGVGFVLLMMWLGLQAF